MILHAYLLMTVSLGLFRSINAEPPSVSDLSIAQVGKSQGSKMQKMPALYDTVKTRRCIPETPKLNK